MSTERKKTNLVAEVQDLKRIEEAHKQIECDNADISVQMMSKQHPDLAEALQLAQLRGNWKMAASFERIAAGATVSAMASLLEGNRFKRLPLEVEEFIYRPATDKDEFCRLVFNKTRTQCTELISDFRACNKDVELYDAYVSLGLHRDQRRLFRKLPEAEREQAISSAVEKGDKDGVLDLIESMVARHTKEKEQLTEQVQQLESKQKADEGLQRTKSAKIDELLRDLNRDLTPNEEKQRQQDLDTSQQEKLKDKAFACINALNELGQVVDEVFDRGDRSEFLEEALYGSLRGVLRQAMLIGREHQIDPVHVLGVQLDVERLDAVLDRNA